MKKKKSQYYCKRKTIFKFITLQTLFIAKTIYGIDDIKINKECMQELDKLIIEDLNGIFDKNENKHKNNLAVISSKQIDFTLKHDDISDESLNDYITLH